MTANYQTELDALNAIYDAITDKRSVLIDQVSQINENTLNMTGSLMDGSDNTVIQKLVSILSAVDQVEPKIDAVASKTDTTNSTLANTNLKLDSEIALTQGIRGAVVDVKNLPTDACIIRVYVGDQTKKREAAARELTRLLGEGYRPYQTFGISEDLARVLFVKYPEPNDANPVEP